MLSHSNPEQKILNLFERLVDQELDRQEKKRAIKEDSTHLTAGQSKIFLSGSHGQTKQPVPKTNDPSHGRTKTITASSRRLVFERARSKCEFPGCDSTYQLQIDHRWPRALGGDNKLENLRVLCRIHNIFEAKRLLGREKVDSFRTKSLALESTGRTFN